jgi:selenium metabolism protein YedF
VKRKKMMKHDLDCRGLACPAPVLQTKDLIEKKSPQLITILVDNEAASQNVSRFLGTKGYEASVTAENGIYTVTGKRGQAGAEENENLGQEEEGKEKIMVMVATDRMGQGDDELGLKLMISFIKTLKEMGEDLWRLVFVNNGVKLTIGGSEVLASLKEFEEQGLHILVCGTCLTHFDLLDQKEVGETTNMLDIVTAMQVADKVINI